MKNLILSLLMVMSIVANAQDTSPIEVNLSDNAKLQWNGSAVKQKAIVLDWRPLINGTKEFYIKVRIVFYANSGGSYGGRITDLIIADQTLSSDQRQQLLSIYADRYFDWQSTNVCVDQTTGDVVNCMQPDGETPTVNAVPESAYWQSFKLNQVSGVTSISTQGAFDAEYKIIKAVVAKMNLRKNW